MGKRKKSKRSTQDEKEDSSRENKKDSSPGKNEDSPQDKTQVSSSLEKKEHPSRNERKHQSSKIFLHLYNENQDARGVAPTGDKNNVVWLDEFIPPPAIDLKSPQTGDMHSHITSPTPFKTGHSKVTDVETRQTGKTVCKVTSPEQRQADTIICKVTSPEPRQTGNLCSNVTSPRQRQTCAVGHVRQAPQCLDWQDEASCCPVDQPDPCCPVNPPESFWRRLQSWPNVLYLVAALVLMFCLQWWLQPEPVSEVVQDVHLTDRWWKPVFMQRKPCVPHLADPCKVVKKPKPGCCDGWMHIFDKKCSDVKF